MDVSDIFYFLCSGEGKGESDAPGRGGGVDFLLKNARGGSQERGEGEGAGWVSVGNFGVGGGLNIFFRGRNAQSDMRWLQKYALPISLLESKPAASFLRAPKSSSSPGNIHIRRHVDTKVGSGDF